MLERVLRAGFQFQQAVPHNCTWLEQMRNTVPCRWRLKSTPTPNSAYPYKKQEQTEKHALLRASYLHSKEMISRRSKTTSATGNSDEFCKNGRTNPRETPHCQSFPSSKRRNHGCFSAPQNSVEKRSSSTELFSGDVDEKDYCQRNWLQNELKIECLI